jgi:hypothetical protein
MSIPSPQREQLVRFEDVTLANHIVAFFDGSLKALVAHLNLPIYLGYDELDEILFTFLTLPSGKTVTLGQYRGSPQRGVDLHVDPSIQDIPALVYESCQQLKISRGEVRWLHTDVQEEVDLLYVNHGDFPRRQEISSIEEWPQSSDHEPIDCFNHSLNIYPEQKFPVFWATLQRNLGLAYCHRIQGDRRGNLERSIECFTRSLQIYKQDEFSIQWGIINDDIKKAFVLLDQTVDSSSEVLTLSLKSQ